ncbi:TPA: ABC transporter ATP-binding protein [Clostridioides difficile]|uniref:ABC transporter, ATP-binding protein n=6 Tax=Clostridioides difficile TaxID=1496 RepID=D5Q857_CLODI|nr:ABC transporter ATP-binding protein [Clostridioides difficile]EFH05967.1 ABC transporter, ATP-binding protein [Clostridioides difficile NAP08]EFH17315.1 ABC transporter, ATP-binding protein [Clostridioides difficile NAP07]CCK88449.1 ABC superfamily ATP binding cassette transporter ATP-binding and permease [Clostridioides difficile T5]CCK91907.1 ABC superfamily ATP binding cassette transporter ATP-binding and permease [Clostridioides difficile T20]CCK95588.1 ABC superfamily ATP binding casse
MIQCQEGNKLKNTINMKKFLYLIIQGNKKLVIISFLMMIVVAMIDLYIPQIIRNILDIAIKSKNITMLIKLILQFILINIILSNLELFLEYNYSKMKKKITTKLKLKLLRHLSKLDGRFFSEIKTGNIMNIVEYDVMMLDRFGIELIFSLIVDIITAFISLYFLIKIQSKLLVIVVVIQIVISFTQYIFTKMISKYTQNIRSNAGSISNIVQEYISNIMNVVIHKGELNFFTQFLSMQKNFVSKCIKLDMIMAGNVSLSKILNSLIVISIYGYGGYKIINGEITFGELVAFQQYTGMLIGPCMNIIKSNAIVQQSLVSINRIFDLLNEEVNMKQENTGEIFQSGITKKIRMDMIDVSFSYDKEDVLHNINMSLESGNIYGIVGGSGSGKSTLIKLIYRLWDIESGSIRINDVDIRDYNLKNLRKNITIITQEPLLLNDTVFNNIILSNKNINYELVVRICKELDIYDFIVSLPNEFNTIVGENGVKLSGGQKQRISIARAMLSNSSILVLDEATSALDNISQKDLLKSMKKFLNNKIVIIIAHRLSTIKDSDKIFVINNGEIIESGSHKDLVSQNGYYCNLLEDKKEYSYC